MKTMQAIRAYLLAVAVAALCLIPQLALAQVQENLDLGAVIPITSAAPLNVGTTNSADLLNATNKGVLCQFTQVSSTGSPSATINIQSKDAASGLYDTILASSAITTVTSTYLAVYPGMQTSSLPTGWSSLSAHINRIWRVQAVVTGSGGFNATLGCNLLN